MFAAPCASPLGTARMAALLLAVLLLGDCRSVPPVTESLPEEPTGFSTARAGGHLAALAELAPRATGSPQAEQARAYLRGELEALELSVEEIVGAVDVPDAEPAQVVHLATSVPGSEADDAFLLLAAYTGPPLAAPAGSCADATAGASGAALLLELTRTLTLKPLPYETRVVFVDQGPPLSELRTGLYFGGGVTLLSALAASGELARVRLAVSFGEVGEPNLVVARDLLSHRTFRERFFRAAARVGRGDVFPRESGFESTETPHRGFVRAGFRSVVAIAAAERVDPDAEAPSPDEEQAAPDATDRCSTESLRAVAEVGEAGLGDLAALLRKVDRFVRRPAPPSPEAPSAEPPETVGPGPDAEPEGGSEPPAGAATETGSAAAPPGEEAETADVGRSEPPAEGEPESPPAPKPE